MSGRSARRRQAVLFVAALGSLLAVARAEEGPSTIAPRPKVPPVQAFCIDFNWQGGKFAAPGQFAHADPQAHLEWYRRMGVNTIQTFAVSCNGYAWYKGGTVVPPQPELKHDFLVELVRLGHAANMKVMGYFCVGANTRWGKENPDYSYGTPSGMHLPFTTRYLDFLCESMVEALKISDMDGFMIDWVFNPARPRGRWLDSEKQTYRELMGKDFPGEDKLGAEELNAYQRASVDRCWQRIRKAVKTQKPRAVLWLSCHNLNDPQVKGSRMFQEIDWLMNEHPDFAALEGARNAVGSSTRIVQCVCGWGSAHNTTHILRNLADQDVGFYGFAEPDVTTTLPPESTTDARLAGNAWNIQRMRRAFLGLPAIIQPAADGSIVLPAALADTTGPSPIYLNAAGQEHIGWWGKAQDTVRWTFYAPRAGQYSLSVTYSCAAGGSEFTVEAGAASLKASTSETGGWATYATHELGKLNLAGPGAIVLTVRPAPDKPWKSMGLKAVTLKP